jgi:hypothetical protein
VQVIGGVCSNGGALSSIGVSLNIVDSDFTGSTFHVRLTDTKMVRNRANEGGGAIFFVSNDRTGTLTIESSVLRRNPSLGFENFPGIFFLGRGRPTFTDSVVR